MTSIRTTARRRTPATDAPDRGSVPDVCSIPEEQCRAFTGAVELFGRRWSGAILLALARGNHRFSEVRGVVPGLSDRMLAQRLRELEQADLVVRTVVPTTPVQVRYALTERGGDLIEALQPVVAWAHRWDAEAAPQR